LCVFVIPIKYEVMKHGSLFSGIGGFDLASSWIGWENVFNCERDRFCRRVLKHYWPETKSYEEIKTFNAAEYKGQIDVLSGGFPCQPFSQAGKRKGTADDRYLWPEMLRIIGEVQPCWVVGENVFGLLNWKGGMVFRQMLVDLEAAGYEVWLYVLPAAGVGAPHRRNRIWFIAHANCDECQAGYPFQECEGQTTVGDGGKCTSADTNSDERCEGRLHKVESGNAIQDPGEQYPQYAGDPWEKFPTESPVCGGNDGLPRNLDGTTFSSWRRESIKAFGNAIVPYVAIPIFQTIERMEYVAGRLK
jgi:DNA (cytosine-5)-methyltransferase 1